MLLDVVAASKRNSERGAGQGLRLYGERARGRPRVSRPRTEAQVDRFSDRAVRVLFDLRATCSIRVAFEKLTIESVGDILEVTRQGTASAMRVALRSLLERSKAAGLQRKEVVVGVIMLVQQSELIMREHRG